MTQTAYMTFEIEEVDGLETYEDVAQHLEESSDQLYGWTIESKFDIYAPGDQYYQGVRNDLLDTTRDEMDEPRFYVNFDLIKNYDYLDRFAALETDPWIVEFEVSKDEMWWLAKNMVQQYKEHPELESDLYFNIAQKFEGLCTPVRTVCEKARQCDLDDIFVIQVYPSPPQNGQSRLLGHGISEDYFYTFTKHMFEGVCYTYDTSCENQNHRKFVESDIYTNQPIWEAVL